MPRATLASCLSIFCCFNPLLDCSFSKMGNSLRGAYLDSPTKVKNEEQTIASASSGRCSCSDAWKPVTFDTLFDHVEQVFPRNVGAASYQLSHSIYSNARLSHKAALDVWRTNKTDSEKQYVLDLFWHGKGVKVTTMGDQNCIGGVESSSPRGMTIKDHAQRLIGSMRCDPMQHIPNTNGFTIQYGRLEYIAERFVAGIHSTGMTFGSDKFFRQLNSRPDTVAKGNIGFHAMVGLNSALTVGVQIKHCFSMVGACKAIHMGKLVDLAARISFPQDHLVVSAKLGAGKLDLNVTVCPLPNATFGIAVKTLISNTKESVIQYGMKLDFPKEAMDVKIGMNSNREIVIGGQKKLDFLPIAVVFTSVFGGDNSSYKFGLGLQADL